MDGYGAQERQRVMTEKNVECIECGCTGNMSCGHEPLDGKNKCTLDSILVCHCCRLMEKPRTAMKNIISKIDNSIISHIEWMEWVKPIMSNKSKTDLSWMSWREGWERSKKNNSPWCKMCEEKDCTVDEEKCEMIREYLKYKKMKRAND